LISETDRSLRRGVGPGTQARETLEAEEQKSAAVDAEMAADVRAHTTSPQPWATGISPGMKSRWAGEAGICRG
jgi:hypothetical protein